MKEQRLPLSCLKPFSSLIIALIATFSAHGQAPCNQNSICLRVVEKNGAALIGVSVEIGDDYFTTSDNQGYCAIPKPYAQDTALINYLGFRQKKVALNQMKKQLNIVILEEKPKELGEVLILGRTEGRKDRVAQQIKVIDEKEIEALHVGSTADILEKSAAVFVQKSQFGGGSPIIRGFEANRVLLVVDKVRLNNAIYRSGHLQNSITIDPALLQSVEVLYGAHSLLYGSDAIGGVVHYRSRDPELLRRGNKRTTLRYGLRYGTAARDKSIHVDFNYAQSKIAFLTSVSFTDFDDLRAGSNAPEEYPDFGRRDIYAARKDGQDIILNNDEPYRQIGTAYNQLDINQKILYQHSSDLLFNANLQFSTTSNIPRYDNLIEPGSDSGTLRWAEWNYGPQNRIMMALESNWTKKQKYWDNATFILANQAIDEERITRRFNSPFRTSNLENVNVFSFTADFSKRIDSVFTGIDLKYGLDVQLNNVNSSVEVLNISDSSVADLGLTRYPDDLARLNRYTLYTTGETSFFDDRLIVQSGLRIGIEGLRLRYTENPEIQWPEAYLNGINKSVGVFSFSKGAVYNWRKDTRLRASLGTAYRNPNIDDQAKIRIQNNMIQIPNLDLKPERSFSAEIGIERKLNIPGPLSHTRFQINAYYTFLNNALVRQVSPLPDGDTILISEGERLTTIGNVNANSARVRGLSLQAETVLYGKARFSGNFQYTRGVSELQDGSTQPTAHIPPVFGLFSLSSVGSQPWRARLDVRYNGKKDISLFAPNSSDNPELATPEGSLAWTTWNLYFDYDLDEKMNLSIGLENIFDVHYRTFSSGVSAPGRNLSIRLSGKFH